MLSGLLLADVGENWVDAGEPGTGGIELVAGRPPLPAVDIAANAFGAELLLPKHRVRELHAELGASSRC